MNRYNAYDLMYKTGVSNLALEAIISKDCYYSYIYAKYVLRGKFDLGERLISKNEYYYLCYAKNVLKGRFRLGEETIVQNCFNTCEYLVKVMRYDHE